VTNNTFDLLYRRNISRAFVSYDSHWLNQPFAIGPMKQTIVQIKALLEKLEGEAETADEVASIREFSGFELPDIISDIIDLLMPSLTPYQSSLYMYLIRHSIIANGTPLLRVSTRGLRSGVIKSASGQSEHASYATIQGTLEALQAIGAIRKEGEPNREGTPYRILMPEEIELCQSARERLRIKAEPVEFLESDVDYYNIRQNRLKIYERDSYVCQHCDKQLTRFTATLDHVTAVSRGGDNSLTNLITACRECNSKKNSRLLGDFMADMNPT
jgi:hypothetical protein